MNEAVCKSAFVKEMRATTTAVVLRHEDQFTHGIPDISISFRMKTIWFEGKFVKGKAKPFSKGIQRMTMENLSKQTGNAYYIIWQDGPDGKETFIVEPEHLDEPIYYMRVCYGFNPRSLCVFIIENFFRKDGQNDQV